MNAVTVPTAKTCFKCGQAKPRSEFYAHRMMADGLLGKCKECAKADVRANRSSKIDYVRAYDRARGSLPHRVEARAEYVKTEEGKKAWLKGRRAFVERWPNKRTAHVIAGNAIRDGRLKPAPCEWCGAPKAQAHHFDYTQPLSVTWFCHKCHQTVHRIDREHKRRSATLCQR